MAVGYPSPVFTCDRCGAQSDNRKDDFGSLLLNPDARRFKEGIGKVLRGPLLREPVDLCPACVDSVLKWFSET